MIWVLSPFVEELQRRNKQQWAARQLLQTQIRLDVLIHSECTVIKWNSPMCGSLRFAPIRQVANALCGDYRMNHRKCELV